MKILILLFFCGILNVSAVPSNSLFTESSVNFKNSANEDLYVSGVDSEQQKSVSGTVTDAATGQSMPGVNILVKGTTIGALTDANGKFTLMVSDLNNAILVFSFVGYGTKEVPVAGKSSIDISLVSELTGLEEVVVIGYGTVKKKDLTGSIASIGAEELKKISVTRVDEALLGKVAGVQVKTTSGQPGVGPQIRIRGVGSISAGVDPLYVIDGFPTGSLELLDPNDIESIDILKDASATAIYGSRGANGVVIITTKRGKAGKVSYTFDTYFGLQKTLKKPNYMNAMEQAKYYVDGVKNRNIDAGNDVSSSDPTTWKIAVPVSVMDVINGINTIDTDWLDAVLRTAPEQQYHLSASGGNEDIKFAISGEYLNQDGIVIYTGLKRYSLRTNIDAKLSKRLKVTMDLNSSLTNYNDNTTTGNYGGESVIGDASSINAFFPVYNPDGTYFVMNNLTNGGNFNNAVAEAEEIKNSVENVRLLGNVSAEYTIIDGLKLNARVGATKTSSARAKFKPMTPELLSIVAYGEDMSSSDFNWLTEYTLNYNKSFGKHNIVGLVGYTVQKDNYRSNYITSNKYPNNLVYTLSAVANNITGGTSSNGAWALISYLARVNYNFESKYYVTASIRTDGSSRFGSENKYGVFPSVALAWRISEEKFLKDNRFIGGLKLRASYGETGNNNIGDYQQYATINYENYPLSGSAIGGFGQALIANPFLTWEKQKQFNTGFDVTFFKDRINFTADYFNSINSDLLLNVNIPSLTGFTSSMQNIGKVKNTGWEFVVGTRNLTGKFEWSTDLNFSFYKNKVLALGPTGDPIYSGANVTEIGQPIGMFYGWKTDGYFKTQAELAEGPIFSPGTTVATRVGDVRFVDISGPNGVPDGIINSFDKTIMGSPYPDFYYGMTNRFLFRNFTLSVSLQGSKGNKILNQIRYASFCRARTKQVTVSNNYWKSEADPGDGERFSFRPNDAPTGNVRGEFSDLEMYDGSYLRINDLSLSYSLPNKICQKLMLSSLRLYLESANPFIFTTYTYWNPDTSNSNDPLQPGRDNNGYPITKTFIVGLNLVF